MRKVRVGQAATAAQIKKMSGLRIISGQFKGRRLEAPDGPPIRPTSDRLRERIFSILQSRVGSFEGLSVADIFAGTGAMGIEAISRGAAKAWFVEKHQGSLELLRGNLEKVGIAKIGRVIAADARQLPKAEEPFNILFLDPPYGRRLAEPTLTSLVECGWAGNESLVIVEIAADDPFDLPDEFRLVDERQQGNSRVVFAVFAGAGKSTAAK